VNREAIIAALELEAGSCCLDDEADREHIADRVLAVLRNQHDALVLREFWRDCTNDGQRLIAFSERRGNEQSRILEAAYRLAGGRS
jgi:hypothetical protein